MRIVYERAVGLDVHLKVIQACLEAPSPGLTGTRVQTQRQFKTFTDSLEQLADWITETGTQVVAMESTAMYWLPVWQMLERRCPSVKLVLVNPHQVQQVPGRKTDPLTKLRDVAAGHRPCVAPSTGPPRRPEHRKHQVRGRDLGPGPHRKRTYSAERDTKLLLIAAL